MQGPLVRVRTINADAEARTRPKGVWQGPFRYDSWVMDWCGLAGHQIEVGEGDSSTGVVARPQRSWFLFAPGVRYRHLDTRPPQTEQALWIIFDIDAGRWPLAGRRLSVVADPDERLVPYFYAMRAAHDRGAAGDEWSVYGLALAALGEVVSASQGQGAGTPATPWRVGGPGRDATSLATRLEREVLHDLAHPPDLARIAERLGMSVSSLAHRCKAETGQSAMARVRRIRIREAQRLLRAPRASVKQTAAQLGFSSAFHFSTVFRAVTGLSPSDYMERLQRGAPA